MNFEFEADFSSTDGNCAIVILVFEDEVAGGKASPKVPFSKHLEPIAKNGEFAGKLFSISAFRPYPSEADKPTIYFVGAGKRKDADMQSINGAIVAGFNAAASKKAKKVYIRHVAVAENEIGARNLASWISMAGYKFDKYKTSGKEEKAAKGKHDDAGNVVEKVIVVGSASLKAKVSRGLAAGAIMGKAANLARVLDNEPPNVATPRFIAKQAQEIARKSGLKCKVIGKQELVKMGMGSFLAVSHGSVQEPVLLVLEYHGGVKGGKCHALVGKGITFDSGGISIKPAGDMDKMKFDKSGACTVIAAMSVLKELGVRKNVVAVAPLTENLPSGSAYKPGDIVTTYSGKTVEVLNTDAEGRMVLADALAYTVEKYNPSSMLDFATLTGACVVALGDVASGLFSNDENMAADITIAGSKSGERVWRLPLWREYDEKIKSDIADIKNIGEPGQAGAASGASFLKEFVGNARWCHVDIAGTAWNTRPKNGLVVGATGVGARMALEYLMAV